MGPVARPRRGIDVEGLCRQTPPNGEASRERGKATETASSQEVDKGSLEHNAGRNDYSSCNG